MVLFFDLHPPPRTVSPTQWDIILRPVIQPRAPRAKTPPPQPIPKPSTANAAKGEEKPVAIKK